ncbi:MAG TPA: FecR domain-containing protein, partial [Polyangiales bacterium]|nr:FecR domain-containing protein [Polyangiales bacterium]
MTDRPFDSRHSGEILREGQPDGTGERMSRGLLAVVQHARQLTRSPAREATERVGRDRLLAAASMQPRPIGAKNPFGGRGVWARLRAASPFEEWQVSHTWAAVAAVACLAVLSYTLLGRTPSTLPTSLPGAPLAASGVLPTDQPLTYSITGGQPSASNYLVAPAHASASLRFSDGSDVAASPSTRLRVDSVQARGARVLLEDGVARADITHRENTNWVFVAGPFDVRITGTTFTLAWNAADQVLDLTLHEGSVEVASPLGASQIKVKTGQHFHASVTDGTMQLLAAD